MAVISAPLLRRPFIPARRRQRPIEGALTFPSAPLGVQFEIAPGADLTAIPGTWVYTDIADDVMLRDGGILITVGRAEGAQSVESSTMRALWRNPDGIYTRTNPNSPLYGLLSRNLPAQVSVNPGTGPIVRARQYVTSLPPRWDPSDNDKYMPVIAAGVLRRLGQGSPAPRSTVTTTALAQAPIAYWPCSDAAGATTAASALSGLPAMTSSGAVFAADTGCPGAPSLASLPAGAALAGTVPTNSNTTEWTVPLVMRIATAPTTNTVLLTVRTTGTIAKWVLTIEPATPPTADTLYLRGYNSAGTVVITASGFLFDDSFGEPGSMYGDDYFSVRISAFQVGSDVTAQWGVVNPNPISTSHNYAEASVASNTIGAVTDLTVGQLSNTTELVAGEVGVFGALSLMAAGSLGSWDAYPYREQSMLAFDSENSIDRVIRVCDENNLQLAIDPIDGLAYRYIPSSTDADLPVFFMSLGEILGPQPLAGPVEVLRDAEVTNGALLAEDGFGARWKARGSYYYLTPDLELDYAQGHITDISPADDDRRLFNDWTAGRTGGSSARYVDEDSVAAEGRYDTSVALNLYFDADLIHQASWRVNLGTTPGLRYPSIVLDFTANPALIPAWAQCKVGSRITIANPPASLPPDMIDLLIEGWTELIGFNVWRVELVCSPYRPYEVFTIGDSRLGRLDTAGSSLTTAIDTDDVTLAVASTGTVWTPSSGDWPFDIEIGGERMTVTSVTGSTSPQTLTATRSVNTVVKAHAAGAAVRAWRPGVLAL